MNITIPYSMVNKRGVLKISSTLKFVKVILRVKKVSFLSRVELFASLDQPVTC